jgi:hypothetical protein
VILPAPWPGSTSSRAARDRRGAFARPELGLGHLAVEAARGRLARGVAQREARERRRQRDLLIAEGHLIGADRLFRRRRDQLFGHGHQAL